MLCIVWGYVIHVFLNGIDKREPMFFEPICLRLASHSNNKLFIFTLQIFLLFGTSQINEFNFVLCLRFLIVHVPTQSLKRIKLNYSLMKKKKKKKKQQKKQIKNCPIKKKQSKQRKNCPSTSWALEVKFAGRLATMGWTRFCSFWLRFFFKIPKDSLPAKLFRIMSTRNKLAAANQVASLSFDNGKGTA